MEAVKACFLILMFYIACKLNLFVACFWNEVKVLINCQELSSLQNRAGCCPCPKKSEPKLQCDTTCYSVMSRRIWAGRTKLSKQNISYVMYFNVSGFFVSLFSVFSGLQVVPVWHAKYVDNIWLIERSECAMPAFTTSSLIFSYHTHCSPYLLLLIHCFGCHSENHFLFLWNCKDILIGFYFNKIRFNFLLISVLNEGSFDELSSGKTQLFQNTV